MTPSVILGAVYHAPAAVARPRIAYAITQSRVQYLTHFRGDWVAAERPVREFKAWCVATSAQAARSRASQRAALRSLGLRYEDAADALVRAHHSSVNAESNVSLGDTLLSA